MVKRFDCGYAYKTASNPYWLNFGIQSNVALFWKIVKLSVIGKMPLMVRLIPIYDTQTKTLFFGSLFHSLVEIRKEHKTDLRNLI